jgi:hypothetical protein
MVLTESYPLSLLRANKLHYYYMYNTRRYQLANMLNYLLDESSTKKGTARYPDDRHHQCYRSSINRLHHISHRAISREDI